MEKTQVRKCLDEALSGRRLLQHEFYVRWNNGELSSAELVEYAEQYRHFEAVLPRVLLDVSAQIDNANARDDVAQNLADEIGPPAHVDMFDDFIDAVGGSTTATPMTATTKLVNAYEHTANAGGLHGLAGISAYEIQSADIAVTKGKGLCKHYGLAPDDIAFWTLHGELEVDHATWCVDALAELCDETQAEELTRSARSVADAWWAFLDERQARSVELVSSKV